MKIEVEYIDLSKKKFNNIYNISLLAFIKHMAIAGQGYSPKPYKLMRTLGMFVHYNLYTRNFSAKSNKFSEPPIILSDPTEKGHFSNLAGRAIADYLSKRIHKSKLTVTYEAAMKIIDKPYTGPRPDLIAFNKSKCFTIEAKGYSKLGPGDMNAHKIQAGSGSPKITVNFSVASVAYGLYESIKVKYHDPINDDEPFNVELLAQLSREYYSGLLHFLNNDPSYREVEFEGKYFYEVDIIPIDIIRMAKLDAILHPQASILSIPGFRNLKLILPKNIRELAKNGLILNQEENNYTSESDNDYIDRTDVYIDNDGVGLMFKDTPKENAH